LTAEEFLQKSRRALDSAKILLREDDAEGACNRAYYAMFCAARAALVMTGAPEEATRGKTHHGLHAAFNLFIVKPGLMAASFGAAFRRAERLRLVSDYIGEAIERDQAARIIGEAAEFIAVAGGLAGKG